MAQFLRPDSNVTQTGFTGGFTAIDEVTPSDADRAFGADGGGNVLEVGLSNPASTPSSGTATLRVRLAEIDGGVLGNGSGAANPITIAIFEGATQRFSTTASPGGAWQTFTFSPNLSAVTNWNDLRIRISDPSHGGNPNTRRAAGVSWAELEVADGLTPITGTSSRTLAAATVSAAGDSIVSSEGTTAVTLAGATSSSTGTLPIDGTATPSAGPATSTATAVLALSGVSTNSLAAATVDAVGGAPVVAPYSASFNFRATAGYVTDGVDEHFVPLAVYPQTSGDETFGWNSITDMLARDRTTGGDVRLAGNHQQPNSASKEFQIDLPSAGTYDIVIAMGDPSFGQTGTYGQILDDTAVLHTLSYNATLGTTELLDASGYLHDRATFFADTVRFRGTFSTSTFKFRLGGGAFGATACVQHIAIAEVPGTDEPSFSPDNTSTALVLSNADKTVTNAAENQNNTAFAEIGRNTGKYYFEVTTDEVGNGDSHKVGLVRGDVVPEGFELGDGPLGVGYRGFDGNVASSFSTLGTHTSWGISLTTYDIMIAVDLDAQLLWVGLDGTWLGDPAAGTGGLDISGLGTGLLYPAVGIYNSVATLYGSLTGRFVASEQEHKPAGFTSWAEEPAAGPITGTASPTLAAAASTSTATLDLVGQTAATLGDATSAGTGELPLVGASSNALGDATLEAVGDGLVSTSGNASITLGDATSTSQGQLPIAATGSATLGVSSVTSQGVLPLVGTSSSSLGDAVASSTATLPITGSSTITLGAAVPTSQSVLDLSGFEAATLADATLSAAGGLRVTGAASGTLADATVTSTGVLPVVATSTTTLGAVTPGATATLSLTGDVSATLAPADVFASSGTVTIGTTSATLTPATGASTATIDLTASLTKTLGAASVASTGALDLGSVSGTTLAPATSSATATIDLTATSATTLGAATSTANAILGSGASATITLDGATLSSQGDITLAASLAVSLAGAEMSSTGALVLESTLSSTTGAATSSAAGNLPLSGAGSSTLGDATLEAGGVSIPLSIGNASNTLNPGAVSSVASLQLSAAVAASLGNAVVVSSGTTEITGQANVTLADATASGGSQGSRTATASNTLGGASATSVARVAIFADVARTLAGSSMAASGTSAPVGNVGVTLTPATMVGSGTSPRRASATITLGDLTSTGVARVLNTGDAAGTLGETTINAYGYDSTVIPEVPVYARTLSSRKITETTSLAYRLGTRSSYRDTLTRSR